jgi:prepilin-type processing-associated H-X9-DG protein
MMPVMASARALQKADPCIANVKQVAIGILMYSGDYDDLAPRRAAWMDVLMPYLKRNDCLTCPVVAKKNVSGYGYALNSTLDRKSLYDIKKPATVPMVYDSINYARNASDALKSLPKPGRHEGKNVIGYVDGHAAAKTP